MTDSLSVITLEVSKNSVKRASGNFPEIGKCRRALYGTASVPFRSSSRNAAEGIRYRG